MQSITNFMEKTIGHLIPIPVSEALYSPWNLALSVMMGLTLILLHTSPGDIVVFRAEDEVKGGTEKPLSGMVFAERLEHRRRANRALPLLGAAGLSVRDIMGCCLTRLVPSGIPLSATFAIPSML